MSTSHQPLSRTDLAALAGVTPQTLRNWEKQKLIPAPETVSPSLVVFDSTAVAAVLAYAAGAAPSALQRAKDSLGASERVLDQYLARKAELKVPPLADIDATIAHGAAVAALDRGIASARADMEAWRGKAAKAEAEEQADALRAEEEDFERESAALAGKLERDWDKATKALLALLSATAANESRKSVINERRRAAGLGYISGAEERARGAPAQTIPAVWSDQERWAMPDGSKPTFYIRDQATGEMVPKATEAKRITESIQVRPKRFEPARMPTCLAEAVVLPGLRAGDPPIWPPAR